MPVKLQEYLTPVIKSGNRSEVVNYRPIAISSNFGKIFESIIANNLYSHVSSVSCQRGFMRKNSTVTIFCEYTQFMFNESQQMHLC